jgi:hypothetical protein
VSTRNDKRGNAPQAFKPWLEFWPPSHARLQYRLPYHSTCYPTLTPLH